MVHQVLTHSLVLSCFLGTVAATSCLFADKESGPGVGTAVPACPGYVVGEADRDASEKVDLAKLRAEQPTLYFVISNEKWDRPPARLLKELDNKITRVSALGKVVVVWLTNDLDAGKEYLPRAQQSLKLERSLWTIHAGEQSGPEDWNIHADADVTIVLARNGKVVHTIGYTSPNETLSEKIIDQFAATEE